MNKVLYYLKKYIYILLLLLLLLLFVLLLLALPVRLGGPGMGIRFIDGAHRASYPRFGL